MKKINCKTTVLKNTENFSNEKICLCSQNKQHRSTFSVLRTVPVKITHLLKKNIHIALGITKLNCLHKE